VTDNQALFSDAAERRLAWLEASVLVDPLTGLGNRRAAEQAFEAALASSRRHDAPVAVALVDIDGLKAINDAHGHAAGDDALLAFADALRQSMRAGDSAYRFGGDEFVVLSPGGTAAELARLFDRVRIAAPAFTVGVAQAPADGTTERVLIAVADQRMYAVRRRVAAATTTVVPVAGRQRRLVTVGAVLAVLTLGVPVLAWARQLDRPDARATGATTTTVTSTTTTSVATETVVADTGVAPAVAPIVAPVTPSSPRVTRAPVARAARATTPTTAPAETEYEATAVDEPDRRAEKKPKKHGRGGGRGMP
jgi:diguanylate cyclase (GGDEF)-like protein